MAKSLSQHLPGLLRKSFERYGFAYADILSQWPAIVGGTLAGVTQPERIVWPRRPEDPDEPQVRRRKSGGSLVVRAAPAHALEVQHRAADLIERINRFYGYGAIAEVKVVQGVIAHGPGSEPPPNLRLDERSERMLRAETAGIGDERLRESLRRLGRGVRLRK